MARAWASPSGTHRARFLLQGASPFVLEVVDLCGEGLEGRIEIVKGGAWDQPAKWREGVLIFRAAYHGELERQREIARKRKR